MALRPEHLRLSAPGGARSGAANGSDALAGRIAGRSFIGNLLNVTVETDQGGELLVECRPDDEIPEAGSAVEVTWARERAIVLLS